MSAVGTGDTVTTDTTDTTDGVESPQVIGEQEAVSPTRPLAPRLYDAWLGVICVTVGAVLLRKAIDPEGYQQWQSH